MFLLCQKKTPGPIIKVNIDRGSDPIERFFSIMQLKNHVHLSGRYEF